MKLKFELVNGYGVLADENPELNKGDFYIDRDGKIKTVGKTEGGLIYSIEDMDDDGFNHHYFDRNCEIMGKIIFAESELKLEGVPVFEWRDFEPNEKSLLSMFYNVCKATYPEFDEWIEAKEYKKWLNKSNPAKFTEEDLIKVIAMSKIASTHDGLIDMDSWISNGYEGAIPAYSEEEIIQSLQNYPKYIVMSMEAINDFGEPYSFDDIDFGVEKEYRPKLFTNSEGKQQGIIKELIWA